MEYRFDGSTGLEMKNNLSDGDIWHRTPNLNPTFASNIFSAVSSWFVDADNADLHLNVLATEAIDSGVTLAEVPEDIDGDFRPNGIAPDIGADEFIPEPCLFIIYFLTFILLAHFRSKFYSMDF